VEHPEAQMQGFAELATEQGSILVRPECIVAFGPGRRRDPRDAREMFILGADRPFFVLDTLENARAFEAAFQHGAPSSFGGQEAAMLRVLLSRVATLSEILAEVRMTVEAIQAQIAALKTSVGEIAPSLENIKDSIPTGEGGATAAQLAAISTELETLQANVQGVVDSAKALADSNPDPTPES
jgi:hypothetical protein